MISLPWLVFSDSICWKWSFPYFLIIRPFHQVPLLIWLLLLGSFGFLFTEFFGIGFRNFWPRLFFIFHQSCFPDNSTYIWAHLEPFLQISSFRKKKPRIWPWLSSPIQRELFDDFLPRNKLSGQAKDMPNIPDTHGLCKLNFTSLKLL